MRTIYAFKFLFLSRWKEMRYLRALMLACMITLQAHAQFPTVRTPDVVGIAGNDIDNTTAYNDAFATGAKWVRRAFHWTAVEATAGVYDFSAYDAIVQGITNKGMGVVGILAYNNPLYENTGVRAIKTAAGRQGFANFAAAVADHYKNYNIIWEIWNEPNSKIFWDPNGTANSNQFADDYVALVNVTAPAMKAADPNCTIVAGSMAAIWSSSLNWLNRCIQDGLLTSGIDGLSIHPYPPANRYFPEMSDQSATDGYVPLKNLLNSHGAGSFPIFVSEVGFQLPYIQNLGVPANEAEKYQAWHFVRQNLIDQKWGMKGTMWYVWSSQDVNFSMIVGGVKRPVYFACQTMVDQLAGYSYDSQITLANPLDYVLRFENSAGAQTLVAWTAPDETDPVGSRLPHVHNVTISVGGTGTRDVYDYLGNHSTLTVTGGNITVNLDGGPKYIVVSTGSPTALPSPWQQQDIGAVGQAGSATHTSGTFSVDGGGADIWGTADEFHYVYRTLSGDGQIIARVTSLENTNVWAKAGVMIRENLNANSRHAAIYVTPGSSIAFQRRLTAGGTSAGTNAGGSFTAPYWLRVQRTGNSFSAYRSANGTSWVQVGTAVTIAMGTNVFIGMAVTAHNDATLATAQFTNVSVTGNQSPGARLASPASPEEETSGDLIAYPNPAADVIHIKLNEQSIKTVQAIHMVNSMGQAISVEESIRDTDSNTVSIPTKRFGNGVYILRVGHTNGLIQHKKVIINR